MLVAVLVPGNVIAQGSQFETERALTKFARVFRFIKGNYVDDIDADVLLEGALEGLLDSLDDPNSGYIKDEALRRLEDTTSGSFGGVGMYISKQPDNEDGQAGYIEVIAPIEDTPADRLGVRAKDVIVEIDGTDTVDMTIDDAVNALRGPPGTSVDVRFARGASRFNIDIVRTVIQVPVVRWGYIGPDEGESSGGGIGYIRIIQFTPFTHQNMLEAIREFEAAGYSGLIVDVRQNPGGLLSAAVDVSGLFLDGGLVVGTTGRNDAEVRRYNANRGKAVEDDIELVVLVDAGSASASEIFAGAMKDYDRGVIIGEKTFGKGSVQQIRPVDPGAFRLTMSLYYTPSGTYIDDVGIIPDIIAAPPELTEEQTNDLAEILRDRVVEGFIDNRTDINPNEIDRFVAEQIAQGSLTEAQLRKLIKDEQSRVRNVVLPYDLEYDLVLQKGVQHLRS